MAGYAEALNNFIKTSLCSVIGTFDGTTTLIRRALVGDVLDDLSYPSFLNRHLCNQEPPPVPSPPYQGGQCPNVLYIVSGSLQIFNRGSGTSAGDENWAGEIYGPIRSIKIEDPNPQNSQLASLIIRGGDGAGGQGINQVRSVANELFGIRNLVVSSVVRADGLPDSCGSPPVIVPPPAPGFNERSGDITYDIGGNSFTVPVVAAFGYASLNVDAEVTIPINVDVGGIELKAEFNFSTGDLQFWPTNNYYGDRRRGNKPIDFSPLPGEDTPDYPPSLPPAPPDLGEEEGETERVIVGVVVTVTSENSNKIGTLFQDDNPDISVPNLGFVSFLCRTGRLDAAWTADIPVKNRRHLIPCPWEGGAFRVGGTPRPGVEWELTPIYSKKEQTVEFPVEGS